MQADAEAHAEEDAKKKELADVKNTAEMTLFTAEKSLKDFGDKIDASLKTSVEEKITALKLLKDASSADKDSIHNATEALSAELSKIGEAMQKAGETSAGETTAEVQNEEIPNTETTSDEKTDEVK
jgi:molecular chaperone DnaK